MQGEIWAQIEGDSGFATELKFQPEELQIIRELVNEQWRYRLLLIAPELAETIFGCTIEDYHQIAHLFDHTKIWWPPNTRFLLKSAVQTILQMSVFNQMEVEFGRFSTRKVWGEDEMVWRLVRPAEPSDVGPFHCDSWFWKIRQPDQPFPFTRIKAWVALYCESGLSGLRVVPNSHRQLWQYREVVAGADTSNPEIKPQLVANKDEMNSLLVPTEPGEVILFHDDLLHAGAINRSDKTRVSIEFTLLIPDG